MLLEVSDDLARGCLPNILGVWDLNTALGSPEMEEFPLFFQNFPNVNHSSVGIYLEFLALQHWITNR